MFIGAKRKIALLQTRKKKHLKIRQQRSIIQSNAKSRIADNKMKTHKADTKNTQQTENELSDGQKTSHKEKKKRISKIYQ